MARMKNALTGYFVADLKTEGEPVWMELAKWISTVSDDTEENTEEVGYYDGDGTPQTDVISASEKYTFEGFYDDEDPAMNFIRGLKRKTGEDRKVLFKKVETFGETAVGSATVTDIVFTGGEATEYPAFKCSIVYDKAPELTTQ